MLITNHRKYPFLHRLAALLLSATILACFWNDVPIVERLSIGTCLLGLITIIAEKGRPLWGMPKSLCMAWILWIIATAASLFTALDPAYSSRAFRHDVLNTAGLFITTMILVADGKYLKVWGGALLCASLMLAISGIQSYFSQAVDQGLSLTEGLGLLRTSGSLLAVHYYLQLLIISVPFWVFAIYAARNYWVKLILLFGFFVVALGWILGYGRMQLFLLPFLVLLFPLFSKASQKYIRGTLLIVFAAAVAITCYLSQTQTFINNKDAAPRQFAWQVSANYIKEHPLSGLGYGYMSFYLLDKSPYLQGTDATQHDNVLGHAHNLLISAWLTTGLQGLLALCFLFYQTYACLLSSIKNKSPSKQYSRYWIIAFLIAMTFSLLINMSDVLLAGNNLKIFWILGGIATGLSLNMKASYN